MIFEVAIRICFVASTSFPYGLKSARIGLKIFSAHSGNFFNIVGDWKNVHCKPAFGWFVFAIQSLQFWTSSESLAV